MRTIRYLKFFVSTFVITIASSLSILYFLPIPPLLGNLSWSRAVYDSHQHLLRLTLSEDGKYRVFVPLSSVSPLLVKAALLQEDRYFHWHPGVNPFSVLKAGWASYVHGSRRMGASTITMQVARMRYRIYTKTVLGKCQQIVRALQLEMHYSKKQILEAYLNLAPYGNNVEGVGAASLIYFGKTAQQINLPEALTLTVIPQHPAKRIMNANQLKKIRNKLYAHWIQNYPQDKRQTPFMLLPMQIRRMRDLPFLAPHFVDKVLADETDSGYYRVTTLDLNMQKIVEKVSRQYIARKSKWGIHNTAIMIVDTRDMGVKALLGSVNFFDQAIGGQVNGTDIKRSPGSTLKPFIYALALEQGLIHPDTVLKDVPHRFGNYNPENFDHDFAGPVKAKDALIASRNIPAIDLADQLKNPSLHSFLQQANVRDLKSEAYYGLALVLGGAELTMTELVELYAMLANEGIWQPLQYKLQSVSVRKRLLSPEASFLILDMLNTQQQKLAVSWKTGTSSGYRDAWTLGVFGPYVMGVWIGNFNNQGNPAFVGKEVAAPLFFEIVNALRTQMTMPSQARDPARLNLKKVAVCKVSGMLPTRYCPETEEVWFIPGKSPIKTDTIHREIAIHPATGLRACHFDKTTRFAIYECWPSDLLGIFKRAGIQRRIPPAYDDNCNLQAGSDPGFAPQVISPQAGAIYIARKQPTTIIPLTAVVDAEVRHIYWFANATFLKKTSRDQAFFWRARPGNYVVRAVDDAGRADARSITVKMES